MPQILFETGAIIGICLCGLLAVTVANESFKFWPTPRKGSWQNFVFWGLFRSLNAVTLALAFLDWQRWDGLQLDRLLGAGLAVSGFGLYFWACYALGRKNLYCGRNGLITKGIYRWTRNPQYATAIPAYLGLAIASHSLAAFAAASLLIISFTLMAFAEERWLEAAYGTDYQCYRRAVFRFFNWRHGLALLRQDVIRARESAKEARL